MRMSLFFYLMSFIVVLILYTPAYAYLDPGTGSMLLQGLAAAFFGILFFSKRIIASIKELFNRSKVDASDSHPEDTEK